MKIKIVILVLIFAFVSQIGIAERPKISGDYEHGSRYALPYDEIGYPTPWIEVAEEFEEEAWAYNFRKGNFQVSQRLSKKFRYVVKYDFIWKDFFSATTNNKNMLNYYRTYSWINLNDHLDLKLEYYIRLQNYEFQPWDNLTHVPHMLLKWTINKKRNARLSVRYKDQRYDDPEETWKDKAQISSYVDYNEKIGDKLKFNVSYNYIFRRYTDNPDETNAVKKSISVGFDYQF